MTTRQLARRIAVRTGIELQEAESAVNAFRQMMLTNAPDIDGAVATEINRFLSRLRPDTPFRGDRIASDVTVFREQRNPRTRRPRN